MRFSEVIGRGGRIGGADLGDQALGLGGGSPGGNGSLGGSGLGRSGAEVPNDETRRALIVAEAKEMGLIADDARAFDDVDKLMAFLDEE